MSWSTTNTASVLMIPASLRRKKKPTASRIEARFGLDDSSELEAAVAGVGVKSRLLGFGLDDSSELEADIDLAGKIAFHGFGLDDSSELEAVLPPLEPIPPPPASVLMIPASLRRDHEQHTLHTSRQLRS